MLKSSTGYLMGCFGLCIKVIIIVITGIFLLTNLILTTPNKAEISNTLLKNKTLFEDAITTIHTFDPYISSVDLASYYGTKENPSIHGVFTD